MQEINKVLGGNSILLVYLILTFLPVAPAAADLDEYPDAEVVESNTDPK